MTVYSQNGYVADNTALIHSAILPGTDISLRMRIGTVTTVLQYVACRINNEVQALEGGTPDEWGYFYRRIAGSSVVSNHGSGTAIDLNATKHPRQSFSRYRGYSDAQVAKIHQILSDCDGVVRWGGDYVSQPYDPMHFEINKSLSYVVVLAAKIVAGDKPGSWKGFPNAAPKPTPPPPAPEEDEMIEGIVQYADDAAEFYYTFTDLVWIMDPDHRSRILGEAAKRHITLITTTISSPNAILQGRYGVWKPGQLGEPAGWDFTARTYKKA